jgi:hypothetical protein
MSAIHNRLIELPPIEVRWPALREEYARFRNPMDAKSIRGRLVFASDNPVYDIASRAAGYQSASTVDRLSWKLKQVLPELIARLAEDVERENGVSRD